jgi:hypothetical protein
MGRGVRGYWEGCCMGCPQAEGAPFGLSECYDEFRSYSFIESSDFSALGAQKVVKKFWHFQILI